MQPPARSAMKLHRISARVAVIWLGVFAGCTGRIGGSETTSSGQGGSGSGSNSGTANNGGGSNTGTGSSGAGNTTGAVGEIDYTGSPQYYRLVRLTNSQWGRAVQDV